MNEKSEKKLFFTNQINDRLDWKIFNKVTKCLITFTVLSILDLENLVNFLNIDHDNSFFGNIKQEFFFEGKYLKIKKRKKKKKIGFMMWLTD